MLLIVLFKHPKIIYYCYAFLIFVAFNVHSSCTLCDSPITIMETSPDTTSTYLFYTGIALISLSSLILFYCVAGTSNTNYDFLNLFNKDLFVYTPKEASFINDTLQGLYTQNELVKHQNEILIKAVDQLTNKLYQFEPKDPNIQAILEHIDQYILP